MEEHRCQSEGQWCSSPHHRFILNFSSLHCHCIMTVLRPLCTSFYVKSRSLYCNWIHPSLSIPYNDIIVCRPAALQSYLDALILLWCTADPSASTADTLSSPHGVPEQHEKAHIVVQVEALHLLGWLWHGRSLPCSAQLHCLQLVLAVAVSISFISGCLCLQMWLTPEDLFGNLFELKLRPQTWAQHCTQHWCCHCCTETQWSDESTCAVVVVRTKRCSFLLLLAPFHCCLLH